MHVSESPDVTTSPTKATPAWLEVRKGALGWIAAERPAWWHSKGPYKGEPNPYRIIADTGVNRMTIYRFKDLQGVSGPAPLEADSIALLVALGVNERRVDEGTAFRELFKVVCADREFAGVAA